MIKRLTLNTLFLLAAFSTAPPSSSAEALRFATTTSTENSGLLERILPPFEKRFGLRVDVVATGSSAALRLLENGDADLVLSHAPQLEAQLLAKGAGVNLRKVMYNHFVIVGPAADPAKVRGIANAVTVVEKISNTKSRFVSRGDESGTHLKEMSLWKATQIKPEGDWYSEIGQGMGRTLILADEIGAYTLSDKGTFLSLRDKLSLEILSEGDEQLFNPYSILVANPARHPHAKYIEAMTLIGWFTSREGQELIRDFAVKGEALFVPSAAP